MKMRQNINLNRETFFSRAVLSHQTHSRNYATGFITIRIISSRHRNSYKLLASGTTTLIISNEEMEDTTKIVKSLEESGLLIKYVSETIENEAKEQKMWISWHVVWYIKC